MSDDAIRSNLLSYIGSRPARRMQGEIPAAGMAGTRALPSVWSAMWNVAAAHAVELRRAEVIDSAGFAAVSRSLVSAAESEPAPGEASRALLTRLDSQIESRIPASVSGAATLGLAREEWLATASRLVWRDAALQIMAGVLSVSEAVLMLAETHVVTIMPAFIGGRPAQPTTLGHYLGAVVGPLHAVRERMQQAFAVLNRSPLGSGLLAGDVLAADREDLAARLGFDGPIPNTFDALSSVEDFIGFIDAGAALCGILDRFVREVGIWIRTDPMSFVLDEEWTTIPEPAHPTLVFPDRLDALGHDLQDITARLDAMRQQLRRLGYGPLGTAQDGVIAAAYASASGIAGALETSTELFATGLIVNRAYLGNRAGRGYTTAGDLATFLMTEEQIPPTAARRISVLVLSRLKEASLEVSGITPDMIDSAALLTIGREIKVEMEVLGRFLAPRRFIERRQVTGSPAPDLTREWIAGERSQLAQDRQWFDQRQDAMDSAIAALVRTIEEAASEASDG